MINSKKKYIFFHSSCTHIFKLFKIKKKKLLFYLKLPNVHILLYKTRCSKKQRIYFGKNYKFILRKTAILILRKITNLSLFKKKCHAKNAKRN